MSTDPQAPRRLPDRPNLRHLKDHARDLVRAGIAKSLADAQFRIARLFGFPSWPKLKAHVEASARSDSSNTPSIPMISRASRT